MFSIINNTEQQQKTESKANSHNTTQKTDTLILSCNLFVLTDTVKVTRLVFDSLVKNRIAMRLSEFNQLAINRREISNSERKHSEFKI